MTTVSWNNEMARSFSFSNIILGKFLKVYLKLAIFDFMECHTHALRAFLSNIGNLHI